MVLLGFTHGLLVGHDLHPAGMKAYWGLLLAMGAGIFLHRNLFVPRWGGRRLRVVGVQAATHNAYTVSLEPEDGGRLPHYPGQFMFLKLLRPGRPSEEHPFTISSSPTQEGPLTATIKQSGDFTNTIDQTRPGDGARIEGPYGPFSFVHHHPGSIVFIAGGIGITPIISMLRYLRDTDDPRPAALIYGNRTERDIAFLDELTHMADRVKVVHVLSEAEPEWDGPTGYVTRELIEETAAGLLPEAHVYVCGPPPMMDSVLSALRELQVEDGRIHYERFAI